MTQQNRAQNLRSLLSIHVNVVFTETILNHWMTNKMLGWQIKQNHRKGLIHPTNTNFLLVSLNYQGKLTLCGCLRMAFHKLANLRKEGNLWVFTNHCWGPSPNSTSSRKMLVSHTAKPRGLAHILNLWCAVELGKKTVTTPTHKPLKPRSHEESESLLLYDSHHQLHRQAAPLTGSKKCMPGAPHHEGSCA